MSIYDEAKVITHEEARNKVKSNHNKFYTEGEFTKDMLDYITQQEKKEKRAKKVEELLTYQNHYIDSIVNELETIIRKVKLSQKLVEEKLEELK